MTTNTQLPKKRIEYIDALRGLTMILVVFSHVELTSFGFENPTFINSLFMSFRMPLFFWVSGYIAYKASIQWNWSTWWQMSKKKTIIQLIPTLIFGLIYAYAYTGLPWWCSGEESCQCRRHKRLGFDPWVGQIPWRRAWQPTPFFLLGNPMDRGAWWARVHGVAKSWT